MASPEGESERGEKGRHPAYFLFAGHVLAVFSLALSNTLLGLTLLVTGWSRWRHRGKAATALPRWQPSPAARRWLGWLALYIALLFASVAMSTSPQTSLRELSDVFNLATAPLAIWLIRRDSQARWLVKAVIVVGLALAAMGLGQFFLGQDDLQNRIRGPLSHYMTFAGVLLICDCLLLAWIACGQGWRRWWAWASLLVLNLALLGSYTRNAWVALGVVIILLLLWRLPRRWLLVAPVSMLLVALVITLLAPSPILQRVASIADLEDPSNYDRLCMTYAGLNMVADRPVLGLGPHMVSEMYPLYRHPTAPRFWVPHLHNSFLNIAAERGLASLLVFLVLLASSGRTAWRLLREEGGADGPRAWLHIGVLLTLVAFSVSGLFEDNWADTEVQRLFLFVLALPFCLDSVALSSPSSSGSSSSSGLALRRPGATGQGTSGES
ncbi:MAG: O-antigen ligase family protein [Acidobacteriota bacterium]